MMLRTIVVPLMAHFVHISFHTKVQFIQWEA